MAKTALITGITGQDGSYLAELLVAKGYAVHGLIRRSSTSSTGRIAHLLAADDGPGAVTLHHGDLGDSFGLLRLIESIQPEEVYNLGAQSHVGISFDVAEPTADITGMGALRLLEAARCSGWPVRFYQAGSSEMFGRAGSAPQTEATPFAPRSPYAVAKVFAHHMTALYRGAHGLHASNGILFNHESPRRGENFVSRKITRAVARIVVDGGGRLRLGNLEARRDWGYAPEYVQAIWLMVQQPQAGDYVVATGVTHSVRDFAELAFALVGLDWRDHVVVDPTLFRPAEVECLVGDAARAGQQLGWRSRTAFADLVRLMVAADLAAVGIDPGRYPALTPARRD